MQSEWPELLGRSGEEAKTIILGEKPHLNVEIIPQNEPVTKDLRFDRVRIFVDENGNVVAVPRTA